MARPSAPSAAFRADGVREPQLAQVRRRLFGLDPAEASFARRKFTSTDLVRQERLEKIGGVFIAGYNAAIRTADPVAIVDELEPIPTELSGFAFEGAAMGFALLDLALPWRSRRFARFLAGVADRMSTWLMSAPVGRSRAHRRVSSGGLESWIRCCAG